MVIARLFDEKFEMPIRYWFILPYQRAQAANRHDTIAPVCLGGPCNIQKHADLDAVVSEVPLASFVTYQFMIRGVHEFDPFYPLLPATVNDLSILWDGGCFLEFSSSAVQVRRVNVIDSVTGFDEAVETFR